MANDRPVAHERPCTLHKSHPTSVAFFDETGAIASDRFFTVGLLRVEDHARLLKDVKLLRGRHRFRDEFKWSGITAANQQVYKELIELLIASPAKFSCFVADRPTLLPASEAPSPRTRSSPRSS